MAERQQEVTGGSAAAAPMCANSCGFFGNVATKNLCSRCYREHLIQAAAVPFAEKKVEVAKAAAPAPHTPEHSTGHDPDAAAAPAVAAQAPAEKDKKTAAAAAAEQLAAAQISAATSSAAPAVVMEAPAAAMKAAAAAPSRCASCRKMVGLLGFHCRCGGTFCSLHRYVEKHACDFDFKTEGREKIAKNNPLVLAVKINKI